ncbi:unnamed protein product [Rotaria sp. Silwood2]|nr:unnamed protein product [Rotaria sp. Silwood2]CAF4524224.1 unnamed protein product [Rotaria sp. Silwood2]CAF4614066.1 unnamed protein product [Rotaria sp. Silwood2]
MHNEHVSENNRLRKLWRHRWFKIICISFIVITILAVTFSMILKFVILAPKKDMPITSTTSSSSTTNTPLTTVTTTDKQPGKL